MRVNVSIKLFKLAVYALCVCILFSLSLSLCLREERVQKKKYRAVRNIEWCCSRDAV